MESQKEFWNIDESSGALLQALIHAKKPKKILEVGTSNGYSAIIMGEVAKRYGGHITTIEFFEGRAELAKENIAKAELSETIQILRGDAVEIMSQLAVSSRPVSRDPSAPTWIPGQARNDILNTYTHSFDFIFLDANKEEYALYFHHAMQIINTRGIIVADNTISHEKKLTEFFQAVQDEPRASMLPLSIGTGLMIVTIT